MSAVALAARALVGVRFRPHGRDPATGLDCVGLAAAALAAGGCRLEPPRGYSLRGGDRTRVAAVLGAAGLVTVDRAEAGDVLLCASGPGALHLGIASEQGLIHADLRAGRVVERPGAPPWPVLGRWRWEG